MNNNNQTNGMAVRPFSEEPAALALYLTATSHSPGVCIQALSPLR
ncbi:hypothetical protein [Porphyromonas pogonae]|nr:hypothetical protein [Porphyromonas pogonae]